MRGKSDRYDEAAATALAGSDHLEPKVLDGTIETSGISSLRAGAPSRSGRRPKPR
jgi:hypothetical protein